MTADVTNIQRRAPQSVKLPQPVVSIVLHKRVCDNFHQLRTVCDAGPVCAELWVVGQFRALDDFGGEEAELCAPARVKPGPFSHNSDWTPYLFVVPCTDHQKSVFAGEDLVRDD